MSLPLCVRIDADDSRSAQQLLADGWREIDVLETYVRAVDDFSVREDAPSVSRATSDDADDCVTIANAAFAPKDKTEWVREAFGRKDRLVFVCRRNGEIVGFVIIRQEPATIVIDLIASKYPRRGIGEELIAGAEWKTPYWRASAVRTIPHSQTRAGTNSTNEAARQFYRKLGFITDNRKRTFHKP